MRQFTALCLALLVVCSGVGPPVAAAPQSDLAPAAETKQVNDTSESSATVVEASPDAPVGEVNGYRHDDSIAVDQSDGLNDTEMEAYVSRSMARVEHLRDRKFTEPVPVEVISREEFREESAERRSNETFGAWNNQVWESLFIVGEDADAQAALRSTYGESVAGYYSPKDDEIKIVSDSPANPTVDNATLVHELTHAMQDQYYDLSDPRYAGETQDGELAADGVVEGEASYVEARYSERCSDDWGCVATPGGVGGGSPPNLGVLLAIFQPYSDGPVYVADLVRGGGWGAVDAKFESPPASTEQTIHGTDEEPVPIEFDDRAEDGWRTFPEQGQNGSDTVGEASIYAMFWYQAREYGADTVDPRGLVQDLDRYDTYDYDATPSNGWANDRVFPYRNGTGDDADYGYVWVTEWDTERDAKQFHDAYLSILDAHDATAADDGVRVVEDGPFADAFRVTRDGTRVTIVNGPTPDAVDDIRPASADGDRGAADGPEDSDGESDVSVPGLRPVVALLALVGAAATILLRRR
ncbi:Hvo_1808 family surface protein [Halegenticoccus tardaugens]|uniref:Hvo_1808 family surface protein n=1 Tax=Halegenticoccus tardaugens TaxID=2071624 RepID=UPI00100AC5E0|nr:Hvo_1808 family surface protein [Halegenticoccus tardaugens]